MAQRKKEICREQNVQLVFRLQMGSSREGMVRDPQERQISEIFNDMSNNESIPLNTTES